MVHKHIVVCCDGTWNTADQQTRGRACPTNVIKTARAVRAVSSRGNAQIVFYNEGVGTRRGMNRIIGGAFGAGLSRNVEDAYRFVVHNLEPGDRLYVFGFSRGAYTARSLCGLIRKAGILRKSHSDRVPEANSLYRRRDVHPDDPPAKRFREQYSHESTVHFLGVWDTVGALGIPIGPLRLLSAWRFQFHDVQLSKIVRNAFHALAVDEHRRAFRPTLWDGKQTPGQRVEQVWFAGAHSNVGGGYPESGLSDEAFAWMMRRAEECGLEFDPEFVSDRIRPDSTDVLRNSRRSYYRLVPPHDRPIGTFAPLNEAVHPSTLHRLATPSTRYAPRNLCTYTASRWFREAADDGDAFPALRTREFGAVPCA